MIPPAPAEQVKTDPDTGITIVVGSFPSDMTPEEVADAAYRMGFVHWFHQGEIRSAQTTTRPASSACPRYPPAPAAPSPGSDLPEGPSFGRL